MRLERKFLLNIIVIFLIFTAFRPGKRVMADYSTSLIALAIAATLCEELVTDLKRERQNHSEKSLRAMRIDKWGIALALAGAIAAAIVVPAIHRRTEQQQAQQEQDEIQSKEEMSKIFSDPKVQQGMKILQDLEARRNATSPATTRSANAATQVSGAP